MARSPLPAALPRDFTDEQKESFGSLAASMSFVGVCLLLFGVLLAMFAAIALYAGLPWAALGRVAAGGIHAPLAWWTVSAGRSLSDLVRTRGGDVDHLMHAVGQLQMLFAFGRAVVVIQTLAFTALAGAFVWCSFLADKGTRCFGVLG